MLAAFDAATGDFSFEPARLVEQPASIHATTGQWMAKALNYFDLR